MLYYSFDVYICVMWIGFLVCEFGKQVRLRKVVTWSTPDASGYSSTWTTSCEEMHSWCSVILGYSLTTRGLKAKIETAIHWHDWTGTYRCLCYSTIRLNFIFLPYLFKFEIPFVNFKLTNKYLNIVFKLNEWERISSQILGPRYLHLKF